MIEFTPAGKRINKKEKEFLYTQGFQWCGCCYVAKLISDFSKGNSSCKLCQRKKSHKWALTNKDRKNDIRNKWRDSRRELEKEQNRNYRAANKEKICERERLAYSKRREEIRKRKLADYHKKKNIINARRREKRKLQMQDPLFAVAKRLRDRIRGIFRRKNSPKNQTTQQILGCDWLTAKNHLESQFVNGMTWANIGEWHIDHIIPLASAQSPNELLKLCHYTNLQPLWAIDNMIKGSKII